MSASDAFDVVLGLAALAGYGLGCYCVGHAHGRDDVRRRPRPPMVDGYQPIARDNVRPLNPPRRP